MENVLTFPPRREEKVPCPFNHRDGDSYVQLSFEDGSSAPLGFSLSTIFVVKEGDVVDGVIHAINTPSGALIAALDVHPDGTIHVQSYHAGFRSRVVTREQIDVIGPVSEVWVRGFHGPRYVLNPSPAVASHFRPVISANS